MEDIHLQEHYYWTSSMLHMDILTGAVWATTPLGGRMEWVPKETCVAQNLVRLRALILPFALRGAGGARRTAILSIIRFCERFISYFASFFFTCWIA